MRALVHATPVCLLALALTVGCSSDSPSNEGVDILDPGQAHYGKTYAEWATDWLTYIYKMSPPECFNAIVDDSGEKCGLYQDPESPVFFLVGNYGGVTRRTGCRVPKDKALFFPIINAWGDNAGVPPEMQLSETELQNYADQTFVTYDTASLQLVVDGKKVTHLERGEVRNLHYVVTLKAGETPYDCMGISGVEGDFPGYAAGYWALLSPLSSGEHTVVFGAHSASKTPANDVTIDAGYTLTVE